MRAKIVDLLHSPARTRASGAWLVGQRGTVVMVLRNGTLALLELDSAADDLPGGVRRWPVHWDDLLVYGMESVSGHPVDDYRLGLSGAGRQAVQHAVPLDTKISLCGESVYPLSVCGWSIPFSPTADRACLECVHRAELP
ncbi:hypothetical protein [Nonomuraea dietziae]|uniref:Uncharacterized protein n=1 Tax=Nonomuraea dietziae TaxID=65515 RepID=A0A7W5V3U7_9ACTN|nr:hypothetical protein [Nonomuraea dietziae]MBB3726920.1 hypothetical protein [Nonomuraea dietziae]